MATSTEVTKANGQPTPSILEQVLIQGDLSKLTVSDRMSYYKAVCESVGLNPLTKPFDYITLNNKLTLYARKDCTDQLRTLHAISIVIPARELIDGVYVVTARASNPSGRTDESTGAVPIDKLHGEAKANAMMKAETKAKRRVTLSICGLGILDESEVESISEASLDAPRQVDDVHEKVASPEPAERPNGPSPKVLELWRTMSKDRESFLRVFADARLALEDIFGQENGTLKYLDTLHKHGIQSAEGYKGKMQPARDCVLDLFNLIRAAEPPVAADTAHQEALA